MAHAEPFSMILLSCLLFLLPSLLCGPKYNGGNLDVNIDQGMIDVSLKLLFTNKQFFPRIFLAQVWTVPGMQPVELRKYIIG